MSKPKTTYSGAELRARAQQFAARSDPAAEAARHEQFFLGSMASAREHFDWIVSNSAWLLLGFQTFADWWEVRVAPLAAGLGMRPTREIARTVIDMVAEEQKALPKEQRRTQRQIAEIVGVGVGTVNRQLNPVAESPNGTPGSVPNGTGGDPLDQFPAAKQAVNDVLDNQTSGLVDTSPVDESGEDHPATAAPGEVEDGGPSSAADVSTPSAPQTGDGSSPEESDPVDEREQDGAGVSRPAPASDLVNTPIGPMTREFAEQLDRLVPDPNPHRAWQTAFLNNVIAAAKAMRGYSGAEIAEKADDELRAEFARFVGDMESLLHETSQAQIARSNVRPLRRVQ